MTRTGYKSALLAGVALSAIAAGGLTAAPGASDQAGSLARTETGAKPPVEGVRVAQAGIADFTVNDASGDGTQPIPLSIALGKSEQTDYTFVMIRGLPPGFKLSAGFQTKDAWAISLRDLKGLMLTPPANFQGNVRLEVLLIKGRDTAPISQNMSVSVQRTSIRDELEIAARPVPQTTAATPSPSALEVLLKDDIEEDKTGLVAAPTGVPEAEETALMQRASTFLKNSDIAAARLLYETLAMRGSSKAAFAMGQTFDPNFLNTLFVKGLKADIEIAKKWYSKAAQLGSPEAGQRLTALSASR